MARGPLPAAERVRRNAPTIPTTTLPASGRRGVAPEPPFRSELGSEGSAWWSWAWSTPQACGWSEGDEYLIARRASLEDDLAALAAVDGLDLSCINDRAAGELRKLCISLAALVTGRLVLLREMRELDDRLGLSPKGLAMLRWKIVDDAVEPAQPRRAAGGTYGGLRAV